MTLDELLLEWSYRSEKGYPCFDSPSDISLLKEILEELDIPSEPIIESLTDDMLDDLGIELRGNIKRIKRNLFTMTSFISIRWIYHGSYRCKQLSNFDIEF